MRHLGCCLEEAPGRRPRGIRSCRAPDLRPVLARGHLNAITGEPQGDCFSREALFSAVLRIGY